MKRNINHFFKLFLVLILCVVSSLSYLNAEESAETETATETVETIQTTTLNEETVDASVSIEENIESSLIEEITEPEIMESSSTTSSEETESIPIEENTETVSNDDSSSSTEIDLEESETDETIVEESILSVTSVALNEAAPEITAVDSTYELVYQGYETTDSRFSENKFNLYVRPLGSTSTGEVAYCFNYTKDAPPYQNQYEEYIPYYTKLDADGAVMKESATNSSYSQAELYRNIMRVLYYGYPNNAAGLQEYYGISDQQFRWATQLAIWHFTDNMVPSSSQLDACGGNQNPYYSLINESAWYWINKPKLITEDAPADYKLNIYKPTGGYMPSKFQWLLSAGMSDKDEVIYHTLSVVKSVIGDGDKTKEFNFTLNLTDATGTALTGTYYVVKTHADGTEENLEVTLVNGSTTFQLSNNESIDFHALPDGFGYTVKEESVTGYTVYINNQKSTDNTITSGSNYKDVTVIYVNDLEMPVPTGVKFTVKPYLLILTATLGLAMMLLRMREEDE